MNDTQAYTPEEAAAILKVTVRTIYTYITTDKLKARKPAGRWLILKEDLDRFIKGEE